MIGEVVLGGLTIAAAEKKIAGLLKDGGFLTASSQSFAVANSRQSIVVLGQVNRPGRYPLETLKTHVSDILAIAGGATATGSDIIILVGIRNSQPFRKEIDIAGMYLEDKRGEDIQVEGGDVIYVYRAPMYYIYGEVQRPGSYRVERNMTLMQALAQGGGPTLRGTQKSIKIFREARTASWKTCHWQTPRRFCLTMFSMSLRACFECKCKNISPNELSTIPANSSVPI